MVRDAEGYCALRGDFFAKLEREFVPADLQERLREQMNELRERNCMDLPDYVGKFRNLVTQVNDMSELDKIMYFIRGLPTRTREVLLFHDADRGHYGCVGLRQVALPRVERQRSRSPELPFLR